MTNYEYVIKRCEQKKNIYVANELYGRYERYRTFCNEKDIYAGPWSNWLFQNADSAMDFANIGDLVLYRKDGRYGIVTGYYRSCNEDGFTCVTVKFPNGTVNIVLSPEDLEIFRLPEEAVKAIASRSGCQYDKMRENCPFKDEYKEPVPPCMKEEKND